MAASGAYRLHSRNTNKFYGTQRKEQFSVDVRNDKGKQVHLPLIFTLSLPKQWSSSSEEKLVFFGQMTDMLSLNSDTMSSALAAITYYTHTQVNKCTHSSDCVLQGKVLKLIRWISTAWGSDWLLKTQLIWNKTEKHREKEWKAIITMGPWGGEALLAYCTTDRAVRDLCELDGSYSAM